MPPEVSKLSIRLRQRPGVTFENGTRKSERNYFDFIIGEQSLCVRAESVGYDLVSVLTKEWVPEVRQKSVQRLLLIDPADFPNNRRSLLVCSECGDLGCGALSVHIELSQGTIMWQHFGYENSWEEKVHFDGLANLGPFAFKFQEYKATLTNAIALLEKLQ